MVIVGKEEFEEKKSYGGEDFEDFFHIAHSFFHVFKAERKRGEKQPTFMQISTSSSDGRLTYRAMSVSITHLQV